MAMKRLHTDSATRELGAKIIPLIDTADTESDVGLTYILRDIGEECAVTLVETRILLGLSSENSRSRLDSLVKRGAVYRISDLKINGKIIGALGAVGKQIGDILSSLLDSVIEGRIKNDEEELISAAKKML